MSDSTETAVELPTPDNALQRWILQRSIPRYRKLRPEVRSVAIERDRFLTSKRSLGMWIGLACGITGTTFGLHAQPDSISLGFAFFFAFTLFAGLFKAGMSAWLYPRRFSGRRLWKFFLLVLVATYAGALSSFGGRLRVMIEQGMPWYDALVRLLWSATPLQFIAFAGVVITLAAVSAGRQQWLQQELDRTRAESERDAVVRQATQARLHLLQAQIQPHFLFNTLAALQHWVDTGDPRAPALLRSLTAFLRESTERMLQPEVPLAQEFEMARHYLEIMQARLGERLRYRIEFDPKCAELSMPPGLLVTLVENAIEHGIEPQLRGGEVQVLAHREGADCVLRVLDDGAGLLPGLLPDAAAEHVGLANSRERLQHAFGPGATVELLARSEGPGAEARLRWRVPPRASAHAPPG